MRKREQAMYNILTAALELFQENGFQDTSVRQIAERAEVALGMINHYFISKEYLGAQVLSLLDAYSLAGLSELVSFQRDPILYDLTSVRVFFQFLSENGYWEFYLDSLRKDFFFNHLSSRPMVLVDALQKLYPFEASEDDSLLYSRYLPYMMEKTVILKKEDGLFPTISYDEVPYLICQTAMSHFIPEADIRAQDEESKRIAAKHCRKLQSRPPEEMILDFVHSLDASLQQASADSRDYLLRQISSLNP